MAIKIGDKVTKNNDRAFVGIVTSVLPHRMGVPRFTVKDEDGVVFIISEPDLLIIGLDPNRWP